MELDKEKLVDALSQIFNIENSYVYNLTRTKESRQYGTMSIDDFVEWGEDDIEELAEELIECLQTEEERLDENR